VIDSLSKFSGAVEMNRNSLFVAMAWLVATGWGYSQELISNIPYMEDGHPRHVLDVYLSPDLAKDSKRPVVFWIHGGGWQVGDKADVAIKPKFFNENGAIFVACNYRLLPEVTMEELVRDVAQAMAWTHQHIADYGGDPNRILVGGHSAGAQLAALLCTDERYLKDVGVPFQSLRGCIPVDGDTYDIPKIIMTAELRQMIYGGDQPTFGHRQKFGNDPRKHVEFSAVTHIGKGKGIPPFLILYFSGNPDTTAQARRLEVSLQEAEVPVAVLGAPNTNHSQLNNDLGQSDDPATQAVVRFLKELNVAK
jgi:acetyl esterase/lipase